MQEHGQLRPGGGYGLAVVTARRQVSGRTGGRWKTPGDSHRRFWLRRSDMDDAIPLGYQDDSPLLIAASYRPP